MIKIIIADDHSVVRRGIKQILTDEFDIQVIAEAANTDELCNLLKISPCDLVILDITMPGKSGLDAIYDIKKFYPNVKILILSMHPEEEIAMRAIKTGADGYLNKDSVPEELIRAIRKLISGGKYISPALSDALISKLQNNISEHPHDELSQREFQVLCLIASGYSLTEIAEKFSLSIKTISTYRSRILEKLNLKSNVEITHYAIKHKLIVTK
jgi:DNA-binding NarL/FixJ family response regulator